MKFKSFFRIKYLALLAVVIMVLTFFGQWDQIKTSLFFGTPAIENKARVNREIPPIDSIVHNFIDDCDVAVVGGGAGGFAAAVQSARMGVKTCLFEDTDWIGGMFTAAGVSAFDGGSGEVFKGGLFGEVRSRIQDEYKLDYAQTQKCKVSFLCFEPSKAKAVLEEMVLGTQNLKVFLNTSVSAVYKEGNKVQGIAVQKDNGKKYIVPAKVTIDASEFGDVIELSGANYNLGYERTSNEIHNAVIDQCVQPLTYVAVIKDMGQDMRIKRPFGYDKDNYMCSMKNELCPDADNSFVDFLAYGQLPYGKIMVNWPFDRWGNDFYATDPILDEFSREQILWRAKNYTLGFLYFLQTEMGKTTYGLVNEFDTDDYFPPKPYVRESRRLIGVDRLTEYDLVSAVDKRPVLQTDSIAVGDYPIDLHFCESRRDFFKAVKPFQIPYGALVPETVDGLLAAEKNISVSHIVNGATRLQPVVMATGQAAGAAAAFSIKDNVELRDLDVENLQDFLLSAGSVLFFYKDLDVSNFAFEEISKVSLSGIFHGYPNLFFEPFGDMTRKDLLKVAYRARSFQLNGKIQEIDDDNQYVSRAYTQGVIQGYLNEEGERTLGANQLVTRAEAVKMVLLVFGYNRLDVENSSFTDVDGWAIGWIERALEMGVVMGMNGAVFDPNKPITRAEAAILISRLL